MQDTGQDVYVGRHGTKFADGHITKLAIWNEQISSAVCQDAMENSYSGLASSTKTDLIAWWDLDVDTDDDNGFEEE